MHLIPGSTCPKCLLRKLEKHCASHTCPWLHCRACASNMRPDLSEPEQKP